MKNFKNIEKLMAINAKKANKEHSVAYNNMVTYYRYYDGKYHTNHCRIINCLYNTN